MTMKFWGILIVETEDIFAEEVGGLWSPLKIFIGFIDWTKIYPSIPMGRPGDTGIYIREVSILEIRGSTDWSPKRIKIQDWIIFIIFGPEWARRNDMMLCSNSGMDSFLIQNLHVNDTNYCIYGDATYMIRPWINITLPCTIENPVKA